MGTATSMTLYSIRHHHILHVCVTASFGGAVLT